MKPTKWTKQEFLAYTLLYVAHCNQFEDVKEKEYILSKIDKANFYKIHTEVVIDSDEDNLNKIEQYLQENNFSQKQKEELIKEIKNVCFADGTVDVIERKVFALLKRIIG